MKIPSICIKRASFDDSRAGWYARNSVSVRDVVPEWIIPGGGVCREYLTHDLSECLDRSISNTKTRISEAESHLKRLTAAKDELNE